MSMPTPGVFVEFDIGVYEDQPARPAPPAVSQLASITNPPASQVQNPASVSRGAQMRTAPICNGTR